MADITQVHIHGKWNRNLPPVCTVASGTVASGTELSFDLPDCTNNQITPENGTPERINELDFSQLDPAFGPVFVEGAEPGDVLRIDILELTPAVHGFTAVCPNFGLLSEEFPGPNIKIWDLSEISTTGYAEFKKGIHIPTRPFLGIMGLAPPHDGELDTIPPYDWGGNIDCKYVTAGSTLLLPIQTAGALFSCGDGHAAQGDGEVCGTAIEVPMKARLRLTVEKSMPWVKSPHYLNRPRQDTAPGDAYAAVGIDADLSEATRKAVRGAIEWLVAEKQLTRVEAYMLCSVAADLKIVQAVDMPHYGVSCAVPLSIFVDE